MSVCYILPHSKPKIKLFFEKLDFLLLLIPTSSHTPLENILYIFFLNSFARAFIRRNSSSPNFFLSSIILFSSLKITFSSLSLTFSSQIKTFSSPIKTFSSLENALKNAAPQWAENTGNKKSGSCRRATPILLILSFQLE